MDQIYYFKQFITQVIMLSKVLTAYVYHFTCKTQTIHNMGLFFH